MKKLLLVVTLFFAVGIAQSSAQAPAPAAAAAKPKKENFSWTKKYMDEAGFDGALQSKIEAAKAANEAELKTLSADAALSDDDKKKQRQALLTKRQTVIAEMLTEAQKAKVAEIRAAIAKRNEAMKQ